jgi:hypothetical protein
MAIREDEIPRHRILREVYRHYLEYRDLVTSPEHDGMGGYGTSDGVIEHGYNVMGEKLADLIGDKDWPTVLEKFTRDELMATGDVEEYQVLDINSQPRFDEDGEPILALRPIIKAKVHVTLSFWDLQGALKNLSPRKREAVFYNVILDQKQKDVAAIMKITTVSVGQYVEQAMLQLSEQYFSEMEITHE